MNKKKLSTFAVLVLLTGVLSVVFVKCTKRADFRRSDNALKSDISQQGGEEITGYAYMKVTANNEVMIAFSSANNDTVDRIFLLSVPPAESIGLKAGSLGNTNIFLYKEKRAMVLHTQTGNRIYFLGLNEDASSQKITSIKSDKMVSESFGGQALGFGLAVVNGKWSKDVIVNATNKYAENIVVLADLTGRATSKQVRTATDDTTPVTCTSGGAGSNGCGISEPLPPQSCSVTCNAGYFACCYSKTMTCTCVPIGTPSNKVALEWGQCGGVGWTGPTECQDPYICTMVNTYFSQCLPS